MRNLFPGYYRPSEAEFDALWRDCIFVFDANILLHIYRYTPNTRDNFLDVLHRLSDRIWLPYQAALDYHNNRMRVISTQEKAYNDIEKILKDGLQKITTELRKYKRHPFINVNEITQMLEQNINEIIQPLQDAQRAHPDLFTSDDLRDTITSLFDTKVGYNYTNDRLDQIYKEAKVRYERKIPPGYEDEKKEVPDKFGDVVLWFQLIDHANTANKPIIFVTDDDKEDWWLKHEGRFVSPRPELIQEFSAKASVQFYMYQGDRFIEYAQRFLELEEQPSVIEEVKEARLSYTITMPNLAQQFTTPNLLSNLFINNNEYLRSILASNDEAIRRFASFPSINSIAPFITMPDMDFALLPYIRKQPDTDEPDTDEPDTDEPDDEDKEE